MTGILAGLRVIELGQVLAAPFAGAIFSDMGAEVLKIERVEGGDDGRRMGADFRHGDAVLFHTFNRGKKSITLDLNTPDHKAAFERLAATADIVVHNLRPGVPAALGIDGPDLCARHPRLIYAAISAFSHLGPMASYPGFEPLIQAYSGLSSTNGGPNDPPMRSGAALCDQGTGMWVVMACLAMLHRRHQTGLGGIVRASLLETALAWSAPRIDSYINTGALPEKHRSGHPSIIPYEAFEAADGPFLICAGNDRLFAKLAGVVGRADWVADERFATNRARLRNKAELFAQLCPALATRNRADWIAALELAGVPSCPINTLPEALEQEQVQALGMLQPVPGEDFRLVALPFTLDGERPRIAHGAPRLGADSAMA